MRNDALNKSGVPDARWGIFFLVLVLSLSMVPLGRAEKSPGRIASPAEAAAGPTPPSHGRAAAATPAALMSGTVTAVAGAREADSVVVRIQTSVPDQHQVARLDSPDRLVLDFINTENKVPFLSLPVNEPPVRKVRVSQFQSEEPKMTRVVLDLDDGAPQPEILQARDELRVVFTGAPSASKQPTPAGADAARRTSSPRPAAKPEKTVPVIRDLAVSEIPFSALAEPTPAEPQTSPPRPTTTPPPPVVITTPPATRARGETGTDYAGQPLTLDLVDIALVDFFRLMAEEGGINVVMDPEIKGTISIKVVKVPWDQIFDAALLNNGLEKKIEGNLVRIARKATLQEEAKQAEALNKAKLLASETETRVKRLNYTKAATLVATLADQKTVRGTIVTDERTNSLILTDIPSSLDKLIRLVETLDIAQPQVEIEARIVSATRDFARDIGVQFGFVQGNLERVTVGGPNTFGTIGGTRPSATPKNTYAAGNSITGRGASQGQTTESAGVSTGVSDNNAGNFNVNLPAQKAFGGIGVSVGNIFDTFLLDAAITAGENRGLAKLISQPKVVAQNNIPAMITQGLRFPVQIIANNTVTVQFQNAALTLTVTPQITYEGNIVLDLKVENNTPDFSRSVNGIPSIRTSESTTRVLLGDGGTTVIGGILIDNETRQEDKVPGLANLPIIGYAFRRTLVSHSTQEVLFFVTPKIVK